MVSSILLVSLLNFIHILSSHLSRHDQCRVKRDSLNSGISRDFKIRPISPEITWEGLLSSCGIDISILG